MAERLEGRPIAKTIRTRVAKEVARLADASGVVPCLAVVMVGEDGASRIYVDRKRKALAAAGIRDDTRTLGPETSEAALLGLIEALNDDEAVHGILVQLPLPPHIDPRKVLTAIDPRKDVDAFHPESVGHALIGNDAMAPCTPHGILLLLQEAGVALSGAEVVIVNHSNLIGKPLAALLINRDATVTVCHKHTRELAAHTRRADVLVTATGVPRLVTADMVKAGAVVIDAGIHRRPDGTIEGDVAADVWDQAAWVTPVPGGVGPLTIAILLENTLRAYKGLVQAANMASSRPAASSA